MALWHSRQQHHVSSSYLVSTTLLLVLIHIPCSSSLEFDYPNLEIEDNRTLIIQGNATFTDSGILLTRNQTDQIGHVKYSEDLQLWDSASGRAIDFTTSFSFTIYSPTESAHGDGMAFFLAEPPYGVPSITDGSLLGLIEIGDNRFATDQKFVAVEFDTFANEQIDPPHLSKHVGVDVNALVSKNSTSWSMNITSGKVYNATVSYSSVTKNLNVSFTGYRDDVPFLQNLSYAINLTEYLPERVTIGFSAANGLFTSRHTLRSWSFRSWSDRSTGTESATGSTNSRTRLVVGVSVGVCVFVGALCLISFFLWRRTRKRSAKEQGGDDDDDEMGIDMYLMDDDFERSSGAKRFSYEELAAATNNFSEEQKLGQGGSGLVYGGFLRSLNLQVAIKKISTRSQRGIKEYASEVKIISQLRHRNLVRLIGWCHKKKDLLLIYEFMSNGNLDLHLSGGKSSLPWGARYNIAQGLASALLYLHEGWEQCVLHRDIKSSNVMLDSNFNAKLGDFGLARLVDHEKGSQTTIVAGTLGYLAPECFTNRRASKESDVYSFGVLILEIACGRKPMDPNFGDGDYQNGLVEWVWKLYGMGNVLEAADPRLCGDFDGQQMERLMIVGIWCAHPDCNLRPSIKQAIHVLEFGSPFPALPLEMPLPTYMAPTFPLSFGNITSASENTQSESLTNASGYSSSSQFTPS